jgi:hypothetical protein
VLAPHLLVPHISQNTGASGDSLLLPASSAGGSVVVGWAALHVCDFAESGGVGLPCNVIVSETLDVGLAGHSPGLTGRRAPLSWEARFWESIDALVVESILCDLRFN